MKGLAIIVCLLLSLQIHAYGSDNDTVHRSIKDTSESCLLIPTAFSANDDGEIDYFKVIARCTVFHFHIRIFDRWGDQVFESYNINEEWQGTKGDKLLPQGVYYYFIEYRQAYELLREEYKGTITLLR